MRIEEVKKKTGFTTEAIFGIRKPPEYMCPTIDKIIKESKSYIDDVDDEDEKERAYYKHVFKGYLEDELNNLRYEIDELREWGESWKERYKTLYDKLDEIQQDNELNIII